ncbi:putative mitochondrial SSU ribosomal protein S23 precursor [Triangularia verruculosa]|uniref:Small ribosomal subunit protein mS29 n=1 Tax=Triangularia verruculosa TaxID=2587418 RepID=A0AAN6XT36_9PEZI|nr:putative mitochondrial SSU ribosomal protein S23 precursor [Triangularia verruculosa]
MSATNCLRCLSRPSVSRGVVVPVFAPTRTAAAFSTTAVQNAMPSKAKSAENQDRSVKVYRAGRKMTIKKKSTTDRGKPPGPGERKAFRKKIVLSNDNALPVPWVPEMEAGSLSDPKQVGKIVSLPATLQDQLRATEAFQPTQTWGLFRKPSTLVREESVQLMGKMEKAVADKTTARIVLTGEKISGKSTMLLQAQSHAYLNGWIVIHLPDAQELTNGSTEYSPIPNTENPTLYMQQNYCLKLLQSIKKSNEKILAKLLSVSSHSELPQNITVNQPLLSLINAAKEAEGAWPVFQALWSELNAPAAANRPPILLSLDNLPHIMKPSAYRSSAFEPIHSHDLSLVKLFVDALSGNTRFPSGGAVIAATNRNNGPRIPSMELALKQRLAAQKGEEVERKDPYFKGYDERVERVLRSVEVLEVNRIGKREARSLMEYWAASGLLRTTVDEQTVSEKWTLGGGGVLGEMERAALLTMRV